MGTATSDRPKRLSPFQARPLMVGHPFRCGGKLNVIRILPVRRRPLLGGGCAAPPGRLPLLAMTEVLGPLFRLDRRAARCADRPRRRARHLVPILGEGPPRLLL